MQGKGLFLGAGAPRGESVTQVLEQFPACCSKCSSSKHHKASTAKPGAESKDI